MRSWEEKINGETEEKKMNRQADFTDGSSSFDDGFDKLYEKIKTMYRDDELETVKRAYETAKEHHKNQLRQSGEPYIIHPIAVAGILADLGMDSQSVAAALLHDTVEDTDVTKADIERDFGDEIAQLVDGVTKLAKVPTETKAEAQAENIRKMLLAMSNDIRVIIIKLADRLHNMRTIGYVREEKRRETALETLEIYAPIAHRLGIRAIKEELEDRAIICLDPVAYKEIDDYLNSQSASRKEFLESIIEKIKERIDPLVSGCKVEGRIKSVHGIYRKMYIGGKTFDEIYDIYAVRIIVESVIDCYNCLGVIHDMFRPIPNRFKDYISTPKPNMYQSLHTTVIGSQGIPFEVQIRTWEMHQTAEYGVAAHWKYKQHAGEGSEKEFEWVRRLLENQQDVEADDYIHSLKVDMFDDEVFVFTPKGKVISLPAGSTPIDFAYAIHSAVGNSMIGAKVNNRIASYDAPLHNGDIVEILTSKSAKGPSRDWLNICQSNQARVKIKQWFKREKREENIVRGKASFEAELRHAGVDPDILQNAEILPVILKKVSFECLDDMYAAIGYGGLTAAKAVGRIRDDLTKATRTLAPKPLARQGTPAVNSSGVIVEDIGSCMIKFSRCCTPVPGDDIIGFITKGYGVSVHRKDCPNAKSAMDPSQSGRWVKVTWAESPEATFTTALEVDSVDRDGLMLDVTTILTSLRLRMNEISARSVGSGRALVSLVFQVHNLTELQNVMARLRGISGVSAVRRAEG